MSIKKEILYIDLDETFCQYKKQYFKFKELYPHIEFPQSIQGFYSTMEPMENAVEVVKELIESDKYRVFFLSAPSEKNPISYAEKRIFIELYFGIDEVNRLIISAHKGLNKGDYLIDDYISGKGQEYFEGKLIQYGKDVRNWLEIKAMFLP